MLAHKGILGNEEADRAAKEATGGQSEEVPDEVKRQISLLHLARNATEKRSAATAMWAEDHVRPERRYHLPGGGGFRKRAMRRVRKAIARRYCQLLLGHMAAGSSLHDRMTGPQRLDSDECW